jgi:PAS domain S-box-containing protein
MPSSHPNEQTSFTPKLWNRLEALLDRTKFGRWARSFFIWLTTPSSELQAQKVIMLLRGLLLGGVVFRFVHYSSQYRGVADGIALLYAVLASAIIYTMLSSGLYLLAVRKLPRPPSPLLLYLQCSADCIFLIISQTCTLNPASEIHLGLVVPVFTVATTLRVRRLFYVYFLALATVFAPLFLITSILKLLPTLDVIQVQKEQSIFYLLWSVLLPRAAFWLIVIVPLSWMLFWRNLANTQLEKAKAMLDHVPFAIFQKDLGGRFTYVNRQLSRSLDSSAREMIGKTDQDFFSAAQCEVYKKGDERALSGSKYEQQEPHYSASEGQSYVWTIKLPLKRRDGTIEGIQGICIDASAKQVSMMTEVSELASYFVFRKDIHGVFTFANRALADAAGMTVECVLGKKDSDLYPTKFADKYVTDDIRVFSGATIDEAELHYYNRDRAPKWVHTIKRPMVSADGTIVGLLGVSWELRQNLIETVPYAVFCKDKAGVYVYANKHFCDRLRRTYDDVVGKTDADLFPPPYCYRYKASDEILLQGKVERIERDELQWNGDDVPPSWVHVLKVAYWVGGEIDGVQGGFWDIKESLLEKSPHCVFSKGVDRTFTYANEQFCLVANRRVEDIIGKSDADLYPKEYATAFARDDERLLSGEVTRIDQPELHYFANVRQPRWVNVVKTPILGTNNSIIGIRGSFWDIHESRQSSERLLKYFLHDVAKPLHRVRDYDMPNIVKLVEKWMPIQSFASTATLRDEYTPSKALELLLDPVHQFRQSVETIIRTVAFVSAQLRAFGVLSHSVEEPLSQAYRLQMKSFVLKDEFKGLKTLLTADHSHVALSISFEGAEEPIMTDLDMLIAIFWVFVENAIKATKKQAVLLHGKSEIEKFDCVVKARFAVKRDSVTNKASLVLEVTDNGCGFDPTARRQIKRLETMDFGSTGFGLRIVSYFAKRMKGGWKCSSLGLGKGSKFTFACPL